MSDAVSMHPVDLLRRFQPLFKHVVLVPLGFGHDRGVPYNQLYFRIKHHGAEEKIHPNYYRDGMNPHALVLFDVYAGSFNFDFRYDSSNPATIDDQLTTAAANALFADGAPLNVTFCVEKMEGHDISTVLTGGEPKVALTWDNGSKPIPGLIVPQQLQARSWEFFIKKGTPEYRAMELSVRKFRRELDLRKVQSAPVADIEHDIALLTDELNEALKQAA